MTNKLLYALWGGMYILCAGLGFIPEPEGVLKFTMIALAVVFFVPGFVLLQRGARKGVLWISGVSLGATFLVLILNFLSVGASEGTGDFLYALLGLISAPMFCARYWVLSLFGWACLLMTALTKKDPGCAD